jgi:hypothetical protein
VLSDTDASSKIPCLVALVMKGSIYSRLKGFLAVKQELEFVRRAKCSETKTGESCHTQNSRHYGSVACVICL